MRTSRPPGPARSRSAVGPIPTRRDRKSTRLNSSHLVISYAVFCLKKKNTDGYGLTHFLLLYAPTVDAKTREANPRVILHRHSVFIRAARTSAHPVLPLYAPQTPLS